MSIKRLLGELFFLRDVTRSGLWLLHSSAMSFVTRFSASLDTVGNRAQTGEGIGPIQVPRRPEKERKVRVAPAQSKGDRVALEGREN